jgi:rhodanese-related sulfurtransferase
MRKKIFGTIVFLMLLIPVISVITAQNNTMENKLDIKNFEEDLTIMFNKRPLSFGVSIIIENNGMDTINYINWNFRYKTSISGQGILLNERTQKGIISELGPGEKQTFNFRPFNIFKTSPIGLGDMYLNASLSNDNGDTIRAQQRSFLFLCRLITYKDTYMDIKPDLAYEKLMNDDFDMIIDVSPKYDEGHLPGSVNYYIGDGSLDAVIPTLDKNLTYLVYCHVDSASVPGAQKLVDAGIEKTYRLEGNLGAWIDAGYPIES